MSTPDQVAETPQPLAPAPAEDRIVLVDALRGLALLGILLVNMRYFAQPFESAIFGDSGMGILDRLASSAVHLFAEGKFYSLFSLLFGLGLFLQMTRAEARGASFRGRWARRLLVLLAIGVAHGCLVWAGDILSTYAVLGFALLLFRRRTSRSLVAWAVTPLLGLVLLIAGSTALIDQAARTPESAQQFDKVIADLTADAEEARRVYGSGSYGQVLRLRASDYASSAPAMALVMGPSIFAMFLLGIWIGRRRLLHEPAAHTKTLRRLLAAGLLVGIPTNIFLLLSYRAIETTPGVSPADFTGLLRAISAMLVGGPALCLAYVSSAALLWQRPAGRRLLTALAPVGRMALSNYLMQSLICTFLFYGYGLGQFGRLGPAAGFALTLLIYAIQLLASHGWMSRFRFGPAEWLWRTLTYGARPRMRVRPAS